MENSVLMGLGAYRFSLDTGAYQSLSREWDFGWKSVPRAANMPHYQNTTLGAVAIELKGVIYPTFRGGFGQIEQMASSGRLRTPLPLVAGTGVYMGKWIIMKLGESNTIFLPNGKPRKMEFSINLEMSGDQ